MIGRACRRFGRCDLRLSEETPNTVERPVGGLATGVSAPSMSASFTCLDHESDHETQPDILDSAILPGAEPLSRSPNRRHSRKTTRTDPLVFFAGCGRLPVCHRVQGTCQTRAVAYGGGG